jgi:hypothetical protein
VQRPHDKAAACPSWRTLHASPTKQSKQNMKKKQLTEVSFGDLFRIGAKGDSIAFDGSLKVLIEHNSELLLTIQKNKFRKQTDKQTKQYSTIQCNTRQDKQTSKQNNT